MKLMSTAIYVMGDSSEIEIEYDRLEPCQACGLPVCEASIDGVTICPWCSAGDSEPPAAQHRYALAWQWHEQERGV